MNRRRIVTVLGALLGVVGLVALAVPSLTTALPANEAVLLALGAVMLLGGLREVGRRRSTAVGYAETADAEVAIELPTPGDDFDRRLEGFSRLRANDLKHSQIREDVGVIAAETIQRREGCPRREAEEELRNGAWTTDPFAATFFTGGRPDTDWRTRVEALLTTDHPFTYKTKRIADELYRLAEGDDE